MTLMLIGNKSDLAKLREVKTEDAAAYAEKEQMALIETSALDSSNVSLAFECIIQGKSISRLSVAYSDRDLQVATSLDVGRAGRGSANQRQRGTLKPEPTDIGATIGRGQRDRRCLCGNPQRSGFNRFIGKVPDYPGDVGIGTLGVDLVLQGLVTLTEGDLALQVEDRHRPDGALFDLHQRTPLKR